MVEARIVEAEDTFFRNLGVNPVPVVRAAVRHGVATGVTQANHNTNACLTVVKSAILLGL